MISRLSIVIIKYCVHTFGNAFSDRGWLEERTLVIGIANVDPQCGCSTLLWLTLVERKDLKAKSKYIHEYASLYMVKVCMSQQDYIFFYPIHVID